MAEEIYCWRCGTDVVMVDEEEWKILQPLLQEYVNNVREFQLGPEGGLDKALRQGFDGSRFNRNIMN